MAPASIALGATPQKRGTPDYGARVRLASIGLAIGLVAAFWLAKLMTAEYGVATTDPATYEGPTAVLAQWR